jgi:hypothetical protein
MMNPKKKKKKVRFTGSHHTPGFTSGFTYAVEKEDSNRYQLYDDDGDFRDRAISEFEEVKDEDMAVKVDFSKPVQTRDGRPVKLVTTSGRGDYPVVGYVDKNDTLTLWTAEGKLLAGYEGRLDLINVPVKRVGWVNVTPFGQGSSIIGCPGYIYSSKEEAESVAPDGPVACGKVEWFE